VETVKSIPNKTELIKLSSMENCRVYFTDYSYTVMKNNKDITTFVLENEYEELMKSKIVVANLLGIDLTETKNTYSSLARQVSEWINIKDKPTIPRIELLPRWSYQKAIPCEMENATSYDMKSAYWQIAKRSKSLVINIIPSSKKLIYGIMSNEVENKWERTKELLQDRKKLRLAVIGVNSVSKQSNNRNTYFQNGDIKNITGKAPTNFESLSLLTIRVAYELTQIQAEEINAPYANADCVISENFPRFWQQLGIIYGIKGSGNTDILGIGAYRCGDKETVPYRILKPTETLNYLPPMNYYRCEYWEKLLC